MRAPFTSHPTNLGAAAAKYVDAFFQNVRWETVLGRREQASRMAPA